MIADEITVTRSIIKNNKERLFDAIASALQANTKETFGVDRDLLPAEVKFAERIAASIVDAGLLAR